MQIILLTHERELTRTTGTGQIAVASAEGMVNRILWQRIEPSQTLLSALEDRECGLVYPVSERPGTVGAKGVPVEDCNLFVILDGTWQEARKIYNRSPYLHPVKRVALNVTETSRYALRRNQRQGGLCTAECVIEILRRKGLGTLAAEIESEFAAFNTGLVKGQY